MGLQKESPKRKKKTKRFAGPDFAALTQTTSSPEPRARPEGQLEIRGPDHRGAVLKGSDKFNGYVATCQNPNRLAPSEHPNPTTKIGSKMCGAPAPKWYHWC